MPTPARAGLFIYALRLERVAAFYESLLGMRRLHADSDHVVLHSADMQLIVQAIPPEYAQGITIGSPPERRTEQALKFFFTVASLDTARALAAALGGSLDTQAWTGPGFTACNAVDPEGNVLQLREAAA